MNSTVKIDRKQSRTKIPTISIRNSLPMGGVDALSTRSRLTQIPMSVARNGRNPMRPTPTRISSQALWSEDVAVTLAPNEPSTAKRPAA
jgi:hypothetical protein